MKVSHDERPSGVCSKCVFQVCVSGVCFRCMFQVCVLGVCSRCVFQVCVPGVCSRCVFQVCVSGVCSRCVFQVCDSGVCSRCVFQVCVPGMFQVCKDHPVTHPTPVFMGISNSLRNSIYQAGQESYHGRQLISLPKGIRNSSPITSHVHSTSFNLSAFPFSSHPSTPIFLSFPITLFFYPTNFSFPAFP